MTGASAGAYDATQAGEKDGARTGDRLRTAAHGTVGACRAQGYELLGVHSSRELAYLLARDVGFVPSAGKKTPPADDCETSA